MNKTSNKLIKIFIVIFFILSLASFIYGLYMLKYALEYVGMLQGDLTVNLENAVQYVVSSTIVYFSFSFLFAGSALCMTVLNRLQRMLCDKTLFTQSENKQDSAVKKQVSKTGKESTSFVNISEIALGLDSIDESDEIKPESSMDTQQPIKNKEEKYTAVDNPSDVQEKGASLSEVFLSDNNIPHDEAIINENISDSSNDNVIAVEQADALHSEHEDSTEPASNPDNADTISADNTTYQKKISSSVIKDIFESR